MNKLQTGPLPKWPLFLLLALLASQAWADSRDLIYEIDPNAHPGAFYRIQLDQNGNYMSGQGDGYGGGTWYYYPETGWYRQWFYNDPYDPQREGHLYYVVFITANDYSMGSSFHVRFNWTTAAWSLLGRSRPPLPQDAPTAGDEALYMNYEDLISMEGAQMGSPDRPGSVEPETGYTIWNYNPEWISIDVKGSNIDVHRGVYHVCIAKPGACYNRATGQCSIEYEEDCEAPFQWFGPRSTCADAVNGGGNGGSGGQTTKLDFGDAPNSYGTTSAANGPKHTIISGVRLGSAIDDETDGRPTPDAGGDDVTGIDDEDGVVFMTTLSPGEPATIEVTASVDGYLNAWMDFNRDGTFDGRDEQIFADARLAAGLNRLAVTIPTTAVTGDTIARFRFNTRGLLSYSGPAQDGEVEDYKVSIVRGFDPQPNSGKGGLKWSQPAQSVDAATPFLFNGWDEPSGLHLHQIVADDWQCGDERPITGFQWWGSFSGWNKPMLPAEQPLGFHISIWTDTPASGSTPGHPGTLVWEAYCTYWTWNMAGYDDDPRGTALDETCFQFTYLLSQDQWFYQTPNTDAGGRTTPATYWLSISAIYDAGAGTPQYAWGWTTRPHSFGAAGARVTQTSDAATLQSSWPPALGSQWLGGEAIEQPRGTKWDLAFELLTNQAGDNTGSDPGANATLLPVYRFWSEKLTTHFYTIGEAEKDGLIRDWASVWKYEGVAFYAHPPDAQTAGSKPVYRFWSDGLGRHFYTASESEKDDYIRNQSRVWTFEGIAWKAYDRTTVTQ